MHVNILDYLIQLHSNPIKELCTCKQLMSLSLRVASLWLLTFLLTSFPPPWSLTNNRKQIIKHFPLELGWSAALVVVVVNLGFDWSSIVPLKGTLMIVLVKVFYTRCSSWCYPDHLPEVGTGTRFLPAELPKMVTTKSVLQILTGNLIVVSENHPKNISRTFFFKFSIQYLKFILFVFFC